MNVQKIIGSLFSLSLFITISCGTVAVNSSDEKQGVTLSVTGYDNKSINCIIENKNNKSILIEWTRSSITYNDHSSNILITGQKYKKAGSTDILPLRVPAGAKNSFSIIPQDCVVNKHNSKAMGLKDGSTVFISISTYIENDSDKNETVLTAKFNVDDK